VVPAIVGPAVAGAIAESLGWRWVFLSVPLLAVPALALLRPTLRSAGPAPAATADPVADRSRDRARVLRALGAGSGLLLLQLGGQTDGVRAAAPVAAGLALLVLTVRSLLPPGTLRAAPGIPAVMVLRALLASAFFGVEVYLPLLLTTERGLSPARAGLALTAGALTWSTGSWVRGRVEGRWSDRSVLRAGGLLIVVGVVLAGLSVWPAFPVVASVLGWGVAGLGMGLSYPTLSLLTLRLSPVAEQGANSSALQVSESLATALTLAASGPAFALLVTARPAAAYGACFALSVALALTAALLAGRIPADRRVGA
jgi:predicted MFS family arabinose efflux permease